MISFRHQGDLKKTTRLLTRIVEVSDIENISFEKYGRRGVEALSNATPQDSGETAQSWSYEIHKSPETVTITFKNSNVNKGVPIAIILQYGHGTKTGGYVQGRDYINPAMRPIFDEITRDAWKEVIKP